MPVPSHLLSSLIDMPIPAPSYGASPSIFSVLPPELIMYLLGFLDVRSLVRSLLVSRTFFHLTSTVIRHETALLISPNGEGGLCSHGGSTLCNCAERRKRGNKSTQKSFARLSFEMGLPSDAEDQKRQHSLTFSCFEPIGRANHSWTPPRASFAFPALPIFPIEIEVPFESFRTVVWGVYVKRRQDAKRSDPVRGQNGRGGAKEVDDGFVYNYDSLVTKGLERIRHTTFTDAPAPHAFLLADNPPRFRPSAPTGSVSMSRSSSSSSLSSYGFSDVLGSTLDTTLLPASDSPDPVHAASTAGFSTSWPMSPGSHPGSREKRHRARGRAGEEQDNENDEVEGTDSSSDEETGNQDLAPVHRRETKNPYPCLAMQLERLTVPAAWILKAHEEVEMAELERKVVVIRI